MVTAITSTLHVNPREYTNSAYMSIAMKVLALLVGIYYKAHRRRRSGGPPNTPSGQHKQSSIVLRGLRQATPPVFFRHIDVAA